MPKLKLKRTVEEEREHQRRKEKREERKRKRDLDRRRDSPGRPPSKRRHAEDIPRKWASSDEDETVFDGARPPKAAREPCDPSFGQKSGYDTLRAELEEQQFRAKMFDALGDDERLDGVETRFNTFTHVPDRWKTAATATSSTKLYDEDEFLRMDPGALDDEEYAEWIRLGMYRKSHAAEHAEHLRKKAAAAERRAAEKAKRAEAARLEKLVEEERKQRKRDREAMKQERAREEYHSRWRDLLAVANDPDSESHLQFDDIPWPIAAAYGEKVGRRRLDHSHGISEAVTAEAFTKEAISAFLLPSNEGGKARKDRLRETLLRFHPDKFEGRLMRRIRGDDQERVREAIGQISRTLNHLLEEPS